MIRLVALLARLVTLLVCWAIVMGVPVLIFQHPLQDPLDLKRFLGVFYALLLLLATLVARSWGGPGVVGVAAPFWAYFSMLGLSKVLDDAFSGPEKLVWALHFGAIFPVSWLAWRLGRRLPSPGKQGQLL